MEVLRSKIIATGVAFGLGLGAVSGVMTAPAAEARDCTSWNDTDCVNPRTRNCRGACVDIPNTTQPYVDPAYPSYTQPSSEVPSDNQPNLNYTDANGVRYCTSSFDNDCYNPATRNYRGDGSRGVAGDVSEDPNYGRGPVRELLTGGNTSVPGVLGDTAESGGELAKQTGRIAIANPICKVFGVFCD